MTTYGWEANKPVHHYNKPWHEWKKMAIWAWDIRGEIPVKYPELIEQWTQIAEGFEELAELAYDRENSPGAVIWERTE